MSSKLKAACKMTFTKSVISFHLFDKGGGKSAEWKAVNLVARKIIALVLAARPLPLFLRH